MRASEDLHQEKFEITPGKLDEMDRKYVPFRRGQVVEVTVGRNSLAVPPAATGYCDDGYPVELAQGARFAGQNVRARLLKIGRSIAQAEPLGSTCGRFRCPAA